MCPRRGLGLRRRVIGESHKGSDQNLVVRGPGLEPLGGGFLNLQEAIEESNIPFLVQTQDWGRLREGFRQEIERNHIVVQKGVKRRTGTVTDEWIHCTLADACSAIDYGFTASASSSSDGPKFLRITDVVSGQIDWNSVPHVEASDDILAKYRLTDGDIVIARTGASTGKSTYVKNPPSSVFASYLVRLRAKPEFDARFLAYLLKSSEFETYIRGVLGDKSAQPNASASTMTAAPLSVPSNKEEQRAISHVLGTLDDKIELNRRMNETLGEMARALFKSWFVDFDPVRSKMEGRWRRGDSLPGFPAEHYDLFPDRLVDSKLGEIPEGWEIRRLGEVIGIHDSKRIPLNSRQRAHREGPYPYYGAAGIMDYVDDYLFDGVYVLIGEDGSVVDHDGYPVVQYVWGQFWVNNHAHVLTGKSPMTTEHLYMLLLQIEVLPYVTGAVQPKLSQRNLKSIPMVAAPDEVCRAFSGAIQPFFSNVRTLTDQSRVLATQRDALLPGLVSGETRTTGTEEG